MIRHKSVTDYSDQLTRDKKERLAAPHIGNKYKLDTLAVHNIITRNISETSHSYTYIKPEIKKTNGQIDIEALKSRYFNPEMQERYIHKAEKTLEILSNKNERTMKSDVFNRKFQNTINILNRDGHTIHNKEFIDLFWKKLNNTELEMFVDSIKVDYHRNHQKYINILREIATHIPTGKTPPFTTAGVSEIKTGGNHNCNTSVCPAEGSNFPDVTLYIGSYPTSSGRVQQLSHTAERFVQAGKRDEGE